MLEIFSKRPMVVLLSILWGLGLATLFASVANSRNCIIVRGELPSDIEKGPYSAMAVLDFGNKDELQTAEIEFAIE